MPFLIRQTLIYAIPLMLVALAGIFAERSGIINIALDGIMIFGAFVGALGALLLRGNPFFVDHNQLTFIIAMLIAAIAGGLFSLLLSFSAIKLKADQTIGGTALNMLAPAIALFIIKVFFSKDMLEMQRAPDSTGKMQDFGFVILNDDLRCLFQQVVRGNFLKSVNIDMVQGFLFDKPLPKEAFEQRLKHKTYD